MSSYQVTPVEVGTNAAMEYRKLADESGLATYALIFADGDEAAAELSGIGAASRVSVGWFDFATASYEPTRIDEQVEVVALLGDIATTEDGKPQVHAHLVVAKRGGAAFGGHLLELHVKPTLEVIVTETPTHLRKRAVPGLPIATIRLRESG